MSRGFSVHSPFAYSFITDTLRGPYIYYDFVKRVTTRRGRVLYRIAARFNPARVCCLGPQGAEAQRVLALAVPRAQVVADPEEAELVVSDGSTIGGGVTVMYDVDDELWQRLLANLTDGMTFSNGNDAVIVRRPDLPRQDFRLRY